MYREIKSLLRNDTVFYSLVIVAVAVIAFGLGRLSVQEKANLGPETPLRLVPSTPEGERFSSTTPLMGLVDTEGAPGVPTVEGVATDGGVIASKSGTKYHYPWCPGAKQIKEANRISFATVAAARASGYTPAANCPGLE